MQMKNRRTFTYFHRRRRDAACAAMSGFGLKREKAGIAPGLANRFRDVSSPGGEQREIMWNQVDDLFTPQLNFSRSFLIRRPQIRASPQDDRKRSERKCDSYRPREVSTRFGK